MHFQEFRDLKYLTGPFQKCQYFCAASKPITLITIRSYSGSAQARREPVWIRLELTLTAVARLQDVQLEAFSEVGMVVDRENRA